MPDPQEFLNSAPEAQRDELVRRHCLRQAQLFLERRSSKHGDDEDDSIELNVLELLLFAVQFGDEREYVASYRILERLREEAGLDVNERRLRSAISSLRDAGVVIGTSQKGYKIPVSEAEVAEFVAHANSIVPPMLSRVSRARSDLRAASLNRVDILASEAFATLRHMVDALSDLSLD
jgi:hypothetical protein